MSKLLGLINGISRPEIIAERLNKSMDTDHDLEKAGGPFIGKRGGKWADAKHTIPWKEGKGKTGKKLPAYLMQTGKTGKKLPASLMQTGKTVNTHRIATKDGKGQEVQTLHSAGHYAVHKEAKTRDSEGRPRRAKHVVTHAPSGLMIGTGHTLRSATKQANEFHALAGDAGGDAKHGEALSAEAMKKLNEANDHLKPGGHRDKMADGTYHPQGTDHARASQAEKKIANLQKSSGEGSRGGKIIGHTGSGKPIYASSSDHAADHKHLNAADHKSAQDVHYKLSAKHNSAGDKAMSAGNTDKAHDHWHTSDYHAEQSEQHEYAHHKKAGTRIPGHLAQHKDSGGPPASDTALRDHAVAINKQHSEVKKGAGMYDDKMSKNLEEVKKLVDSGKKVDDAVRAAYPNYSDEDVLAAVRAYGKMYTDPKQPDLVRSVDAMHNYSNEILAFYRR